MSSRKDTEPCKMTVTRNKFLDHIKQSLHHIADILNLNDTIGLQTCLLWTSERRSITYNPTKSQINLSICQQLKTLDMD